MNPTPCDHNMWGLFITKRRAHDANPADAIKFRRTRKTPGFGAGGAVA